MKKLYIFLSIFIATVGLSACQQKNNIEIEYLQSEASEYTATLQRENILSHDFNADGEQDCIEIEYINMEGSQYISHFEVQMTGCKNPFVLEQYDASFQKMELIDFDGDGLQEILLMFDTHGAGGMGTHDIYVLWVEEEDLEVHLVSRDFEPTMRLDESCRLDGIYDIELIMHEGAQKLLAYQYVSGEGGHADQVGNLVSIVTLDKEKKTFEAEKSWGIGEK